MTLLATTAVSLLFLLTGTFEKALAVTTFFVVLNYAMSFLAVFVLRRREPNTKRPYRAWGYPWTTGVALIGAVAFLTGAVMGDTENSLYALVALAASYPGFLLIRWLARRQRKEARGADQERNARRRAGDERLDHQIASGVNRWDGGSHPNIRRSATEPRLEDVRRRDGGPLGLRYRLRCRHGGRLPMAGEGELVGRQPNRLGRGAEQLNPGRFHPPHERFQDAV